MSAANAWGETEENKRIISASWIITEEDWVILRGYFLIKTGQLKTENFLRNPRFVLFFEGAESAVTLRCALIESWGVYKITKL